ncbi:MAG: transporter ATP-binding protein [Alphaproteobacteria bacterium]|jgi:branched-chain amino acid transport system ATP-binding protein|nr:transporter ATP-binding protein [Alphaproteobacteria bacterium]
MSALLEVRTLTVGYGHVGVLEDVSLDIAPGTIVALVGSNGAGKSTLLRAISGLLKPTRGSIAFDGRPIDGATPNLVVDAGILHVAEGRRLFRSQSVRHNLDLGLYGVDVDRDEEKARLDYVFELFPILVDKLDHQASTLSGGQQQMLAIGQALMRRPKLLMLDEPSLGLAPIVVDQVMDVIVKLKMAGTTILLVEQMVERALEIADHGYVLQSGRLIGQGKPAELQQSDAIRRAYVGG